MNVLSFQYMISTEIYQIKDSFTVFDVVSFSSGRVSKIPRFSGTFNECKSFQKDLQKYWSKLANR